MGTWVQSFRTKMTWNFLRKMGVSLKEDLHFLREAFDAAFPRGDPWVRVQCATYWRERPLIKRRGTFSRFWPFYWPPLKIFLLTSLGTSISWCVSDQHFYALAHLATGTFRQQRVILLSLFCLFCTEALFEYWIIFCWDIARVRKCSITVTRQFYRRWVKKFTPS